MYQKYHTEALIMGSRESGESDRSVALYTKDFGLVYARAGAVRKESSRMRYALQHYTRARVSLVRGKRGWRVAGASVLDNAPKGAGAATFARAASLVRRLVQGEERNEYLFATLAEAHRACTRFTESLPAVELVCVARTLYSLGYISTEALSTGHASFSAENAGDLASRRRAPALRRSPTPISLFTHTAFTGESLVEADTLRDKLLASINRALSEAQL